MMGEKGENGKSAYELAVEAGFRGSVDQWLASLKGKDGNAASAPYVGDNNNWWVDGVDLGIKADGNMTVTDGKILCVSSGTGGKGINVDGNFTVDDGKIEVATSGGNMCTMQPWILTRLLKESEWKATLCSMADSSTSRLQAEATVLKDLKASPR